LETVIAAEAFGAIAFPGVVITRGILTAGVDWEVAVEAVERHEIRSRCEEVATMCEHECPTMVDSPWDGRPSATSSPVASQPWSIPWTLMRRRRVTKVIAPSVWRPIFAAP